MAKIPQPQKSERERLHEAGFNEYGDGAGSLEEIATWKHLLMDLEGFSRREKSPDIDLYITAGHKVGTDKKYALFIRNNTLDGKLSRDGE